MEIPGCILACQSNMLFLHVHEPWGTSAVTELTKCVISSQ